MTQQESIQLAKSISFDDDKPIYKIYWKKSFITLDSGKNVWCSEEQARQAWLNNFWFKTGLKDLFKETFDRMITKEDIYECTEDYVKFGWLKFVCIT